MKRIVLFLTAAAVAAVMLVATGIPAALAQDVKAEALPGGKADAKAGSDEVRSKAEPGKAHARAGGTEAIAESAPKPPPPKPPPPKPPPKPVPPAPKPVPPAPKPVPPPPEPAPLPKPAPAPAPAKKVEAKKVLPPTGGAGIASLAALGAGGMLVGGGLLFRRMIR